MTLNEMIYSNGFINDKSQTVKELFKMLDLEMFDTPESVTLDYFVDKKEFIKSLVNTNLNAFFDKYGDRVVDCYSIEFDSEYEEITLTLIMKD